MTISILIIIQRLPVGHILLLLSQVRVNTPRRCPSYSSICGNGGIPATPSNKLTQAFPLRVVRSYTQTFTRGRCVLVDDYNERKYFKMTRLFTFCGTATWSIAYRTLQAFLFFCFNRTHLRMPWARSTMAWPVGECGMPNSWETPHTHL